MDASEYHEQRLQFALGNNFVTFIQALFVVFLVEQAIRFHDVLASFELLPVWLFLLVVPLWFLVQKASRWVVETDVRMRDVAHGFDSTTGSFLR